MSLVPQSLFARTALLFAATILAFALITWQAILWTLVVPGAQAAAALLTQRAQQAIAARSAGQPLPEGVRFESGAPAEMEPRRAGIAVRAYMGKVLATVQANLGASEGHVHRYAAPSEIWLRVPRVPDSWLVLTWRIGGPGAPLATLLVLGAAALLTLGAAALSARRLTAPLAALACAAARVAEGERVEVATSSGPSEVRSLALAFQSMSHRLAELDDQRELMLGGISHDLRSPLARLRVAVELLGPGGGAVLEEMTADIEEMDRMIGQFLHYVRAGYRETPARACLDELVRSTLATYANDDRVQLELGAPDDRWFAVESLRHALMNLVHNALEYGRPPVLVRTGSSQGEVHISVHDRGSGLSQAQWQAALRPFRRLQDQPSGGHSGLGLAMVERLVNVCEGHLEARRVDGGFLVTVRLPARTPAAPSASHASTSSQAGFRSRTS
ncbi:MAG TPA: ATP-binding protein [Steroidobacteraceae bacterium]|nr:ATP-binding protein [Steroidobacteraceae bacterium]